MRWLDLADCKKWLRYYALYAPLAYFPRSLAYRLVDYLGDADCRRQATVASAIACNLRLAAAHLTDTDLETFIAIQQREYFRMMSRELLDIFCLLRLGPGHLGLGRPLELVGLEHLQEAEAGGRGVIIVMSHYGRPVMLSTALGLAGFTIGFLSQAVDERNTVLTSVDRRYLRFKCDRTVAQAGGRWITTMDDLRVLYKALREGETIIIMQDVCEPDLARRITVPFLGGILGIPPGILRLATNTGARLVYGSAHDQHSGVRAEIRPLPICPQAAVMAAVGELEKDVRNAPWQWWQWAAFDSLWEPTISNRVGDADAS